MIQLICLVLVFNGPDFQWPIDTQHGQTASFGEYRGNRFHMGLDFSTGGVEGMALRPAAAGHIYRVRALTSGYGKVIYMRHEGGLRTVYAHLAAFEGSLAKVIRSAGKDPASDFGTLDLNHPVKKDEVIAHTGESGAGLPHLHFEVRDQNDRPLNPLNYKFPKLPHDGKAVLAGITVIPANPQARVNDAYWPYHLNAQDRNLRVKGAVSLKVDAHIAGSRNSRLGVAGIKIYAADESLLAAWQPQQLAFEDNPSASIVFDQYDSGFGPTQFHYCFDDRAKVWDQPPGYQALDPIVISDTTTISIGISNMAGQETRYKYTFSPNERLKPANPEKTSPLQATTLSLDAWSDQLRIRVHTAGKLALPDRLAGLGANDLEQISLESNKPWLLKWQTEGGKLTRQLARFPGRSDFEMDLDGWQLLAKNLPSSMTSLVYSAPADRKRQAEALTFVSPVIRFGLEGWPARGLSVSYQHDGSVDHLGYYAFSQVKNRWRYKQSLAEGPLQLADLAPLVVAADISPPVVRAPRQHDYFTGRRVVIPLRDMGSGIDWNSIQVVRNGLALDTTYDSDRRWIILPAQSRGTYEIRVLDRAGNETIQSIRN